MSQTSYAINIPAVSYPGQIADAGYKDVLSGMAALAAIPYGVLAVIDASNDGGFDNLAIKVPAASADITTAGKAVGVVLADQARAQDPSVAAAVYPQNSAVPCLRKGRVWVQSETAVVDGAPVFVRFATGSGGSQKGAVRADADTASAAQLPGACFRGSYAAAGYVVVELSLV